MSNGSILEVWIIRASMVVTKMANISGGTFLDLHVAKLNTTITPIDLC